MVCLFVLALGTKNLGFNRITFPILHVSFNMDGTALDCCLVIPG